MSIDRAVFYHKFHIQNNKLSFTDVCEYLITNVNSEITRQTPASQADVAECLCINSILMLIR